MILSPTQKVLVGKVKTAKDALRTARADVHARARAIAEQELVAYRAAVDHEVRIAFAAGVPKLQLRRDGLGTMDAKTLEDSLQRTANLAIVETDPLAGKYALEGDELVVTIDGQNANFELITRPDGSHWLKNITPLLIENTLQRNPVVSHVMGAGRDEATAWMEAHL